MSHFTEWTTATKDLATAAALMAGGGWAVWKWGFEERRRLKQEAVRKAHEMPAIDGSMTVTAVPLDDATVIATVIATWRNRGHIPVRLDGTNSSFEVYEIASGPTLTLGPLVRTDLPLRHRVTLEPDYVLEPQTDSQIQRTFVLARRKAYYVYVKITYPMSIAGKPLSLYYCHRELVWMDSSVSGGH
jgi:hypothetical protein